MAQLYSSIALACTCQFGLGTITVLWYSACKSLVEAAVRAYKQTSSQVVMPHEGRRSIIYLMSLIDGRLPAQQCVLVLEASCPC